MTCEHINEARTKIRKIADKMADPKSSFYKEGSHVSLGHIEKSLARGNYEIEDFTKELFKDKSCFINVLDGIAIFDDLKDISDGLKNCNCRNNKIDDYNGLVVKYNNLLKENEKNVNDYNELLGKKKILEEKYNGLVENSVSKDTYHELLRRNEILSERCKNLTDRLGEYEDYKDKYDDIREEREGERVNNARTNTKLEEKLESANAKVLDLTKRLTGSENENNRLLIKLDEKTATYNQKIENLNNQLTTLRLEGGEKDSKLREQMEEIKRLKKNLGTTQRDAVDEKLQFKQEKLENLATQLGIQLRRIETLRRRFKELIIAQESNNNNNANVAQDNITAIKETLQGGGVNINNIQRICKKCRKLAQLELQLERTRQQQQYEARQEVPPRNN